MTISTAKAMRPQGKPTAIEATHLLIRERIMNGTLAPGERLHVDHLRLELEVSTSTLREALLRLMNDRLVTSEHQKGFSVTPLSFKDFRDITDARKVIETTALRVSMENGDDEWETGIVAAFHRLSRVEDRLIGDGQMELMEDWNKLNADFHGALIARCSNAWLIDFAATLHQQSHRYQRFALARDLEHRDVRVEHKAIFDAAMERDIDLCATHLEAHIEATVASMMTVLEPGLQL